MTQVQRTQPTIRSGAARTYWTRPFLAFSSYVFLSNINFMTVVRIIYLVAHGYNPLLVGLLETLQYVVQFVMELPTGVFADLIGKRLCLACFCALTALQSLLFLFPLVPLIALSYCIGGVAWAFLGGTDEALVWQMARADMPDQPALRYSQLLSRIALISSLANLLGPVLGGIFGNFLQVLPFLATAGIRLLSLPSLFFIDEGPVQREASTRSHPLAHLRKGFQIIWKHPLLPGLLLLSALMSASFYVIFFFIPLYLQGSGFSLQIIGLVSAIGTLSFLLFTASAAPIMRLIQARILIPLALVVGLTGLLLMCLPWSIISVFGYIIPFQAGWSLLTLTLSTVVNTHIPEAQRVTILSCGTSFFDAAMIILFPLFGLGISSVSYTAAYLWILGVLLIGCSIIGGGTFIRVKMQKESNL